MCQALQTPAPSPFFNVTGCGRRSTPIARNQAWAGGLPGPALDSETRRAAGLLGDGSPSAQPRRFAVGHRVRPFALPTTGRLTR